MDSDVSKKETMAIIGHRGAAGLAPENTLAAIDTALKFNIPLIEIDIHRSKDNVLVVMHDKSVNRTTNGNGQINELNWSEISKLDAGSHFSSKFNHERVPMLKDVLLKIEPSNATLIIEVKNPKRYPDIGQQLLNLINETKTQNKVLVISFDIDFLLEFNRIDDSIRIGCLYVFPPQESAPELSVAKIISVFWLSNTFYAKRLNRLRANGIETWAWTVNSKRQIEKLEKSGFKGVVTDFPNL